MNGIRAVLTAAVVTTTAILGFPLPSAAAPPCQPSVQVNPQPEWFYPLLVSGDADFAGHGPAVTVSAKRRLWTGPTDQVRVEIKMLAQETQADWTTAQGSTVRILYSAPTGCSIIDSDLPYGDFDSNGYLARASMADPYPLAAGDDGSVNRSFVTSYEIKDDRNGADVGGYTGVRVHFRPFTVHLVA